MDDQHKWSDPGYTEPHSLRIRFDGKIQDFPIQPGAPVRDIDWGVTTEHAATIAVDDGLDPLPNVATSAEPQTSDWVAGPAPKIDMHKDQRLPQWRYPDD